MTETTNFGLKKPEENDFYDFETQNDNLDVIDEKLKECMECGTAEKVTYENESAADVTNVKEALDNIYSDYAEKSDLANYLLLDGSKPITGNMFKIANGYGAVSASEGHVAMCSFLDSNSTGTGDVLVMFNSLRGNRGIFYRQQVNDVPTDYALLHTGNKPTGTYTGNGSATERTIAMGGIGDVCIINSTQGVAIVTEYGAIVKTASGTSVTGLASSNVKFIDGVLTIASNSSHVNSSSVEYTYQVV